ncbi:MAG: 1-acyl-sn-glycerol-3-phosphate acyltransferase [Bacteroidetes bacterium]|nr:1-acyl-sn-glycerol-3-phosphate acyltransferase [Bacteroidota bacterium]
MFFIALSGCIAVVAFFASKVTFEEDVTKVIPSDKRIGHLDFIFQNSKFMDKMLVNVSLSDTASGPDEGLLSRYADELADSLISALSPRFIEELSYRFGDDMMLDVYNTFYENLPIFLDDSDYLKLDSLTSESGIKSAVKKNFRSLISPAGMVMKKFIVSDPLSITSLALKKLQALQFDENFELNNGYIFANRRKNLLMFIKPVNPSNETKENTVFIKKLDDIINHFYAKYEKQVKSEYFGSVAIGVCNAERLKKDIITTVTIALILLMLFISIFFRKWYVFLVIFLPALFGGGLGLAVLFLVKAKLSAIALGIGSVLLGITVDYALHLFTHYRSKGNIKDVMRDLVSPVLMSSLTTAAAFVCLIFLHSEALFDLGLFAAVSVFSAALFSLIVLPHFIRKRAGNKSYSSEGQRHNTLIDRIVSYKFHSNRWLFMFIIAASVLFVFTAQYVEFESDMLKMGYLSDDLREAEQHLDDISNYRLRSVFLVSSGKNLDEALQNSESVLHKIETLKKKGIVKKSSSVNTLLMSDRLQQERIDRWMSYWTPEKRENVKELLRQEGAAYKFKEDAFSDFYMLLDKKPATVSPDSFMKLKKLFLSEYISETEDQTSVVTLLKAERQDKEKIYSAFAEDGNITILDKEYLTNRFIEILKSDFNMLVIISLLVVFVILTLSFGRIELGMVTFVPMVLSWLWTLGIMGAFGIKFTIFSVIISTFIFGLGIDYSIFITRGLLQEYKYGYRNLPSYKTSILLSALTTVTGIGVLLFAWHPALRSIALLSVIGIISVVLISYTVQPVLFWWLVRKKGKWRKVPVTIPGIFYAFVCYTYFLAGGLIVITLGLTLFRLIPSKKIRQLLIHKGLMLGSKSTMYLMFMVRKKVIIPHGEDFRKPAVVISNHQSLIDIPIGLMFKSKTIILTTDWVQSSPVAGIIARMADFYPVSIGLDNLADKLKEKVSEGYSIFIFPEGTRSADCRIRRFHKGAFYLAERLNLDILPLVLHGSGHYVAKGEIIGKKSRITLKFLDRITPDNKDFGLTYRERTKNIARYFRSEFGKIEQEYKDTSYHRNKLFFNYLYKGPILEWYLRIKIKMEKDYRVFNKIIPEQAIITDLGCGYGFLCYMLSFVSDKRRITGVDYDEEKIRTADHCPAKTSMIRFVCSDLMTYQFEKSDVFILSDVLHYLPENEQDDVLLNCIEHLNGNGTIIVRDGDSRQKKKHFGTKYTEFWSTSFGFNKTRNKLCFTSRSRIEGLVSKFGMTLKVVETSKFTSNEVYIICKGNSEPEVKENSHGATI